MQLYILVLNNLNMGFINRSAASKTMEEIIFLLQHLQALDLI